MKAYNSATASKNSDMLAASEFALSSAAFHGRRAAAPSEMGSGLWRWTEMPERSPASPKSFDCQMALETFYLKRRPEGRRFTRTAAARNVSNVTIRVFGKGANRCAGSAAAGYVLVTQTFPQAHKLTLVLHNTEHSWTAVAAIALGMLSEPLPPRSRSKNALSQQLFSD